MTLGAFTLVVAVPRVSWISAFWAVTVTGTGSVSSVAAPIRLSVMDQ